MPSDSRSRGLFIALEGIDGAGTTTQAHRLASWMERRGLAVHVTREPSSGLIGALISQILRGRLRSGGPDGEAVVGDIVALLFAADRRDHVDAEIEPMLAAGTSVLSDRYVMSSLAYQSQECPAAWVAEINRRAREPDLTVFLRVGVRKALARVDARPGRRDRFERESFLSSVAGEYERLVGELAPHKVAVIDGEQSVDEVARDVRRAVEGLFATSTPPS